MKKDKPPIRAVVQWVYPEGDHGPYAKARTEQGNKVVTFALTPPVWEEKTHPEPGTVVLLEGVFEKRYGWRAERARRSLLAEEE